MTDNDLMNMRTVGEIGRSVDRIEATVNNLSLIVQATVSLTATHSVRLDAETKRADELEKKVDAQATRSAYISGGIATVVAGFNLLYNLLAGKH